MTDLTEQWKKGELPEGLYWIKGSRAEGIYAYTAEYLNHMYSPKNSDRIIEQVPSYEEWQDLKSKLQLKETAYDFDTARLEEENTKLKELLKECRDEIDDDMNWSGRNELGKLRLIEKIDEVLDDRH